MKISVIGDNETAVGFRLAGIRDSHAVASPEEALDIFKALMKDKDTGVIIISERLADRLKGNIKALTEGKPVPLVVEIPDKKGPIERVDPIRELVRRAVGVEIKVG
ncbi:MAG: V-type ATP synthase subunit F [Candidatus Hydrothermarchaeales archaeon]